ncbi:MAG: carboxypeptidase-like regulatory domain-containing protein [bacterium]|nr:carboxypeptidase-like regulatory domain-containing protein [bacterium]
MTDPKNVPSSRFSSGAWIVALGACAAFLIWLLVGGKSSPEAPAEDTTDNSISRSANDARKSARSAAPNLRDHAALVNRGIAAPGLADLSVSVVYDDDQPAIGVVVFARKFGEDARLYARRGIADATGMVQFGPVTPGRYKVWTNRNLAVHAEFRTIERNQVVHWTMVLPVLNRVTVRVVNEQDNPIANAEILSAPLGWRDEEAAVVGRTDESGQFRFATGLNPVLVGARARWYAASRMHYLESEQAGAFERTIRLEQPGGSVEGTVRGPDGQPIAGAVVRVGNGRLDAISVMGQSGPPLPGQSITDEEGRYLVIGAPVGLAPMSVRARDFAPAHTECHITHGVVTGKDVALSAGASIEGYVRDANGELLGKALMSFGEEGQLDYTRDVTDETGFYRLSGLEPGNVTVRGRHRLAGTAEYTFEAVAGKPHVADITIRPGRVIEGTILADGQPVATAELLARTTSEEGGWATTVYSEHDGRFRIVNVAPGDIRLSVQHDTIEAAHRTVLATDSDPIEWSVESREIPTGSIVGRVVDSKDRPAPDAQVALNRLDAAATADESTIALTRENDGGFEFPRLRDGVYQVRATSPGRAPLLMDYVVVEGGEITDLGPLIPPAGHRVTVEVLPADESAGTPPSGIIILSDQHMQFLGSQPVADITPPEFAVATGNYWFELRGMGLANQFVRRSIAGPSKVTFRARPGTAAKIRFAGTQKMSGAEEGLLVIQNDDGVAVRRNVQCGPDLPVTFSTRLRPGQYRVTYSIAKNRTPLEWHVRAGDQPSELVVIVR